MNALLITAKLRNDAVQLLCISVKLKQLLLQDGNQSMMKLIAGKLKTTI